MLHKVCERPSGRMASKAGRVLARKKRGTLIKTAKSLAGSVLSLTKNRKQKRCSPKRSYKRA
jgi:hypothetical protein